MSTLTRTEPLTTPGGLQYPKITTFVTIPNVARRASARQDALVPIVRAYGAELRLADLSNPLEHWGRLDRTGDRTAQLHGERVLVELLETQVIPGLIYTMERAAAAAMKGYNAYLRGAGIHRGDAPFMRRRFRAGYLRAWGQAYAERARVQNEDPEPDWCTELPALAEGAEPDAWVEAHRAVAGMDRFDTFRGISGHARDARERIAAFEAACRAIGTTPDEVLDAQYEAQNDHVRGPVELGEIQGGEVTRLIVALGNLGGLAEARAEVLGPIISAAGARKSRQAPDRWGQIVLTLTGPEPVITALRNRIAVILEYAELAARHGLADHYIPYAQELAAKHKHLPERTKDGWRADFLRGWGKTYASRLVSALGGRTDAAHRVGADPELVGTVATRERWTGERLALEERGAAYGCAAAEVMDPVEFTALAAALGGRALLSAPVIELLPAPADKDDQAEERDRAKVRVPNMDGRGHDRIAALTPIMAAYGQQVGRAQYETGPYGADLTACMYVMVSGPAVLAAAAARAAAALIPVMDRAADRSARAARAGEAYVTCYRTAWGQAYAARIAAALAGDVDARAELPAEQAGPAYLAAVAVDDLPTEQVHRAAARIAAAGDGAGLPAQATARLLIGPGTAGHTAAARSRGVHQLAEVYGLAAWYGQDVDEERPILEQRIVVVISGPAALVEHVTAVAGEQLAAVDALISQLLPAFEQQLDQLVGVRRNQHARRSRRENFVWGIVDQYLRAYGERVAAAIAGRADHPRRVAGEQVDERAAYTAVYALDAAQFAEQAAAVTEAEHELLAAWLVRLTPAVTGPAPALVIVPCGKAKRSAAAPARELYTGSYHRSAMRAAQAIAARTPGTKVAILSARHGLILDLDAMIEPYELTVGQDGAIAPAQLRRQAAAAGLARAEVTVLGGARYTKLARAVWADAAAPLACDGGMGYQIRHLTRIAAGDAAA